MRKIAAVFSLVCILLLGRTALAADAVKMPGGNSMDSAIRIDLTYFTAVLQGEYVKEIEHSWYTITAPSTGTLTIRAKRGEKPVWIAVTDRNGHEIDDRTLSNSKWEIISLSCNQGDVIYVHFNRNTSSRYEWDMSMTVCFDGYHQVSPYPVTTRESTCQGEGENTYFCELCGTAVSTEPIPAKSHMPGAETVIREATCLQTGITGFICMTCGEVLSSTEIPLAAHTPGMYTTVQEATCTGDGVRVQYCTVCNATMNTETVAAYGHSYTEWVETVEATKDHEGKRHAIASIAVTRRRKRSRKSRSSLAFSESQHPACGSPKRWAAFFTGSLRENGHFGRKIDRAGRAW